VAEAVADAAKSSEAGKESGNNMNRVSFICPGPMSCSATCPSSIPSCPLSGNKLNRVSFICPGANELQYHLSLFNSHSCPLSGNKLNRVLIHLPRGQ
jgi:coenzyme F420-reducing hydrogenase gamma subunit